MKEKKKSKFLSSLLEELRFYFVEGQYKKKENEHIWCSILFKSLNNKFSQ